MDCEGEEKEEVRWNKVSAEKIPRVDVMCSCRIECEASRNSISVAG